MEFFFLQKITFAKFSLPEFLFLSVHDIKVKTTDTFLPEKRPIPKLI